VTWGEPLARELARDLTGTRVVALLEIEPDLDPAVHHTNLPYAIISDRHTIALVAGQNVMIDGPQQTNNTNRYVRTADELAANRDAIRQAAVWGISAPAEQGGVVDTALSIMRFLKQRGRWCVYLEGNNAGAEAYISARGGRYRWPAGMWVAATNRGIKLTCGSSERVITSLSELADFASREAPILDAEVLWCQTHVATLAKLRPFGDAALAAIQRAAPDRPWQVLIGDEYFTRDAKPVISVYLEDTREVTATVAVEGAAVKLAIGDYAKPFTSPAEIGARVEEIATAVTAWLASPAAEPPVRDMDYYR
jgi:hypothetical protein